MQSDLLASQLASRLRLPIAGVGVVSLIIATANLFLHVVDDRVIGFAATAVAALAGAMFLCAVCDFRFQRAVSAPNADRQAQARQKGLLSRLTGLGLPVGDKLLATVSIALLVMMLVAASYFSQMPEAALLFAGFVLVCLAQIALMVGEQPPIGGSTHRPEISSN